MTRSLLASLLVILLAIALSAYALAAAQLTIKVVSVSSPVRPGQDAQLKIETVAGADCPITVMYKSGASRARDLVPKKADSRGRIVWVW